MMFTPHSRSSFPIDAIVNEVMNQVVLNNCFQDDTTCTNKHGRNNNSSKKCHSKHPCDGVISCSKNNNNDKNANKKKPCNLVYEKKPMHHEDTSQYAKVSFDVAGFTDSDINVQVDDDYVVTITGERTNELGDVFKIDRRFRLDKKTADVDQIDANITDDGNILEVVVKKKVKAGPRVIKISTTNSNTTKSNTSINEYATTDDESTAKSDGQQESIQEKNKEGETVNYNNEEEEKKVANSHENKKEEKEPTNDDDDLEFEQIWIKKRVNESSLRV